MRIVHLLVAGLVGFSPWAEPRDVRPSCPNGFATDEARVERIRSLLARAGEPRGSEQAELLCFFRDPSLESGVSESGVMRLDARSSDGAIAARIVHLRVHRSEPALFTPPRDAAACGAWLLEAEQAEARATRREDAVLSRLDVKANDPRVGLAESYRARCAMLAR